MTAPFYIPTSVCEGTNFYKSSPVLVIIFLIFLAALHSMQDLSSPTRDQIHAPCGGSAVLTIGLPGNSIFLITAILLCYLCYSVVNVSLLLWGKGQSPKVHRPLSLNSFDWFHSSLGGFPGGSAGKESACNLGNLGLIPGLGRSPGEGKGYPLQYSGLENSMGS